MEIYKFVLFNDHYQWCSSSSFDITVTINIPIYILYGTYGPYLNWFNKNISIPKHYIKDNTISLESAINLIKWKRQQSVS